MWGGNLCAVLLCSSRAVSVFCFDNRHSPWAQTGPSLSGIVTDQNGAALRDVAVTIKNADTGATRTIKTDGEGRYQTSGLAVGFFAIRAAKQGFTDVTLTGISLAVGHDATVDIKMQRSTPDPCTSSREFATTDCTLTWHGVTVYGAYDVGVGWVSHGLPENGYNYEGESLVNRNGYQHRFVVAPNNLRRRVSASGAKKSLHLAGRLCSTLQPASIRNPASSPMRQRPTSSTMASPGPAIRSPLMARARANPSMMNTMAAYHPCFSAR